MLEGLRATCPTLALDTAPDACEAASVDALNPFRARPDFVAVRALAVAEPADAGELSAVVRSAAAEGVPLVARGGGSGLMGAAAVVRPAVVVDLRRMNAVAIDADACLVRAGAGATLASVEEALVPHGLMLGHDPWTVGVATVGGAIGTNGLGYLGARAGSIAAQVQALEAVLADGRIVRTRPSPARSVGLDPAHLLVGTEGTLGIVTEATLAVLPRPEERLVRGYRMPSFEAGVAVAARCRRTGVRIASLDLSAEDLPPAPASLLIVFDGLRGEARLQAERALELVHAADGEASSDAEAPRNGVLGTRSPSAGPQAATPAPVAGFAAASSTMHTSACRSPRSARCGQRRTRSFAATASASSRRGSGTGPSSTRWSSRDLPTRPPACVRRSRACSARRRTPAARWSTATASAGSSHT